MSRPRCQRVRSRHACHRLICYSPLRRCTAHLRPAQAAASASHLDLPSVHRARIPYPPVRLRWLSLTKWGHSTVHDVTATKEDAQNFLPCTPLCAPPAITPSHPSAFSAWNHPNLPSVKPCMYRCPSKPTALTTMKRLPRPRRRTQPAKLAMMKTSWLARAGRQSDDSSCAASGPDVHPSMQLTLPSVIFSPIQQT